VVEVEFFEEGDLAHNENELSDLLFFEDFDEGEELLVVDT